jgi:hypothetical protein
VRLVEDVERRLLEDYLEGGRECLIAGRQWVLGSTDRS